MKRHGIFFVLLASLSTPACSGPRSPKAAPQPPSTTTSSRAARDPGQQDLDRLQGTWRIEASWWNGVREPAMGHTMRIVFQGNQLISVDKDGHRLEETIQLLPDQNPKAIDYWSKGRDQAAPGIYSLEGDIFKWCSAGGNNRSRPTAFTSQSGSKQSLMVLRREKY